MVCGSVHLVQLEFHQLAIQDVVALDKHLNKYSLKKPRYTLTFSHNVTGVHLLSRWMIFLGIIRVRIKNVANICFVIKRVLNIKIDHLHVGFRVDI